MLAPGHSLCESISIIVLLLSSAESFLFDRSQLVVPPFLGVGRSFAVINATAASIVAITDPGSYSAKIGPAYLTITLPPTSFNNQSIYAFFSRRVGDIIDPRKASLAHPDVFLSPQKDILWVMLKKERLVGLHVLNGTGSSTSMNINESFASLYWDMTTHLNGAPLPVLELKNYAYDSPLQEMFTWLLPNGTLASSQFINTDDLGWFLDQGDSDTGPMLYVVTMSLTLNSSDFFFMRVNLTDGSVVNATVFSVSRTPGILFTRCAFHTPSMPDQVGMFAFLNDVPVVITLDTKVTELLAITTLTSNFTLPYTHSADAQCSATAVSGQFLFWLELGLLQGISTYLIDLDARSFADLVMKAPTGNVWVGVRATDNGGAVLCGCNAPYFMSDNANECTYYFYDAINASDTMVSRKDSAIIGSVDPTFGTAVERDGVVLLLVENRLNNDPLSGLLIYNTSDTSVQVLYADAFLGFTASPGLAMSTENIALDNQYRALVYAPQFSEVGPLSRFDWRNPASLDSVLIEVVIEDVVGDFIHMTSLIATSDTLLLSATIAWSGFSRLARLSLADLSLQASTEFDMMPLLLSLNDSALLGIGILTVALFDEDLNTTAVWATGFKPYDTVTMITGAHSEDQSLAYAFYSHDDIVCVAVSLHDANSSTTLRHTGVDLGVMLDGKVLIKGEFIYLVLPSISVHVLRFDRNCVLLEDFDTAFNNADGSSPKYFWDDRLYLGRAPIFTPLFLDCGYGAFRDLKSGDCAPCPNGSISSIADTQACQPCPARTQPTDNRDKCVCGAGFYSPVNNDDCGVCPVGGVCNGSNSLLPAPGYWRANATADYFYECPITVACNGSGACTQGYTGPLCAVCAPHHALVINGCRACTSNAAVWGFWAFAVLVYLALFISLCYSGGSSFSVLKSFISFAQVVTFPTHGPLPSLLRVKWAFLTHVLSLVNLQFLSLVSPDCLLGDHLPYPTSVVISASVPVVITLLIALLFRIPWGRAWTSLCRNRKSSMASDLFREDASETTGFADRIDLYARTGTPLRVAIFVVLLSSPASTRQLASFFTCRTVAGIRYLVSDYTVRCDGGLWLAFLAPVCVLFVLYALGVPAAFFTLLYRYRGKLDLRVLHGSYKDRYYWWDCAEQLRKIAILLCFAVLQPRWPDMLPPCALLITFAALGAHCLYRPYASVRDFWFQTADLTGVCLFFLWYASTDELTTDVLAWVYCLFALCYSLASLFVLFYPLLGRCVQLAQWCRKCSDSRSRSHSPDNELDPLVPKTKQ